MTNSSIPNSWIGILNRDSCRKFLRWYSTICLIVSILLGVITFILDGIPLWMYYLVAVGVAPCAFFTTAASISEREQYCTSAYQSVISAPKHLQALGVLATIAFVVALGAAMSVVGDRSDPSAGVPSRSDGKYFVANRGPKQEVSKEVYYRSLERIERLVASFSTTFYWGTLVTVIYMGDRPIVLKKR